MSGFPGLYHLSVVVKRPGWLLLADLAQQDWFHREVMEANVCLEVDLLPLMS